MRVVPSPPYTRFALLLAAFLGGISLVSLALLVQRPVSPHTTFPDRLTMASGGLIRGSAPVTRGTDATSCTPGDRDVVGKDVVIDARRWYCGHVTVYGGDVTVLGRVGNDVVTVGGNVAVSGEVDGRVLAIGGDVILQPGAHIGGDVQTVGGSVTRAPGVVVGGQIDRGMSTDQLSLPNVMNIIPVRLDWADVLFWAFSGLVISLFLPSQLIRVRLMARRQPAGSVVLGLLAYVIGLIAAIVLVLSCLGIPLALAIGVVLWGGSIFGTAALGLWLGSALVPGASQYRRLPFVMATVLGVTLLAIASTAPVIGGIIRAVVSMGGLGAVLLTITTMRHPSPARRRALV